MVRIGIIGGSGLENPKLLKQPKETEVETPYGTPSSAIVEGSIGGTDVAILSRHGKKHTIHPTAVNSRANIYALKQKGCTHILATSACGSLREEIKPGDFVIADQFIDRTTKRASTFYDSGNVCHIPMAEPFCGQLRKQLIEAGKELALNIHEKGTVVTIEGPRFSSKAESNMFRLWGGSVINMSTVPECVLAREAGLCYAVVCMSTDYDCWHESEKAVDIKMVLETFKKNAESVTKLLLDSIPKICHDKCECMTAYKSAIIGGD
ncbi:S-methyl-5'-thioadenosine phosphorylase [Candidatus Woesearchaeota archaeon]|nr:S-methyl-5'-thioadenosine phosphorylase [Candidatus Woesearchaeota archaeon]